MRPFLAKIPSLNESLKDTVVFDHCTSHGRRLQRIDAVWEVTAPKRRHQSFRDVSRSNATTKWWCRAIHQDSRQPERHVKVNSNPYLQTNSESNLVKQASDFSRVHFRRTLDRSYYYTLEESDIRERDVDQVLYYHTRGERELEDHMLIMADQIWLWVLDSRTVITVFPSRLHSASESTDNETIDNEADESQIYLARQTDAVVRLLNAIESSYSHIETAEEFASLLMNKCSCVFFQRPLKRMGRSISKPFFRI
ncbi:hypothetical protein BCR34DRAFT_226510 [Clohesyomyces aquaticus]|uniref:Uncharacterized protein n=1 Tax=Clohesyomyces aquaticus TaxID=1231657 RepID=A0A1Y1Y8D3_9PLEO|nr:hypothetical protein BCR34DRAFT_226510 [Clohesyomyces aquaticus]